MANREPAPESTLPYPPVHKDKKFVVLSDWCVYSEYRGHFLVIDRFFTRDGTITTRDSNDCAYFTAAHRRH